MCLILSMMLSVYAHRNTELISVIEFQEDNSARFIYGFVSEMGPGSVEASLAELLPLKVNPKLDSCV